MKNFRPRFPGFLLLLVCHDASSEIRSTVERIMVSILEYFTREDVERITFGIGNRVRRLFCNRGHVNIPIEISRILNFLNFW